jgi:2-iminobutanoate/2-iminopropanoate deaminase
VNPHIQMIQPPDVAVPSAPITDVAVCDDLVFVSAQGGIDEEGARIDESFAAEARRVLQNLQRCLEAGGCGLDDVFKVTVVIANGADFGEFNAVYKEFFSPPYPARTSFEGGIFGFAVAVDAVARRR